jgi:hypothetical protein
VSVGDAVVVTASPWESVSTPAGEVLERLVLDGSGDALAETLLAGRSEFPAAGDAVRLVAPGIEVELFAGERVDLAGSELWLSSVPLFDEHRRVVSVGQALSWESHSADNADMSTASIVLGRVSADDPWVVAGGVIQAPEADVSLASDAESGRVLLSERPSLWVGDTEQLTSIPAEEWTVDPHVEPGGEPVGDPGGIEGSPVEGLLRATPPANTRIDVLGVAASGVAVDQAFFYQLGGIGQLNTTLANSSSAGFETNNADAFLVGVLATRYVQAGVVNLDVERLEAGSGLLGTVPAARAAVGADLVTMVVPNQLVQGSTCGRGRWPGAHSAMTIETNSACAGRMAVPHELGHNLGAGHQNETSFPTGVPVTAKAYPASGGPTTCSLVHTSPGCRTMVYSTPHRVLPGTSSAAGTTAQFNADIVSQRLVTTAGFAAPPSSSGGRFTRLTQTRVLDSRAASTVGGYTTPWAAGQTRLVAIGGNGGVPANARAVVVNITAVAPAQNGFIKVYPWGAAVPSTSTMNYAGGVNRASTAIVQLGQYGLIDVYSHRATDVVIDVVGYFGAAAATSKLAVVTPTRAYDSRTGSNTPITGGTSRTINLTSVGVPTTATSAVVNLTAVDATGNGFLSVAGAATSILNFQTAVTTANLAFAPASSGTITIYAHVTTDVVVDVLGYTGTTGTLEYTPIPQVRRLNGAVLAAGGVADVLVAGVAGVPATADAVVLNVTGADAVANTVIQTYPTGAPIPVPSTVNIQPGSAKNNLTITTPSGGDQTRIRNVSAQVTVYADLAGYFT